MNRIEKYSSVLIRNPQGVMPRVTQQEMTDEEAWGLIESGYRYKPTERKVSKKHKRIIDEIERNLYESGGIAW